jgi:hypothetical protein
MKNKFSNFIEDKIKAEFEKRNLLYKNLKKEDISNRDTLEHIRNKFLEFLKRILNNPKCKSSFDIIKSSIEKIEQEIRDEKITIETKTKLHVEIEDSEVKKQIHNPAQSVVKGKPIPCGYGLTPEIIEKNRLWIRPCSTTEPIEKREKQSNGFVYAKFNGYY